MEIKYDNISSGVYMGDAWSMLTGLLPDKKDVVIISDINVENIYGRYFPEYPVITIGTGEAVKEYDTVDIIVKHLLTIGADRSTFLLGIGGGVVCDITGFVASIFMRGIDFGFISTTLLSQVDASIGGKNGVNVNGLKNIIGCFNDPSFVLCDPGLLKTLSEEDYISGLAELVKHALISDPEIFEFIESNMKKLLARDHELLQQVIARSVMIKLSVVEKDRREQGERRLLNFGHTLGHAIESASGASHGISVAAGMMTAAEISYDEALISNEEVERIRYVLTGLGLLPGITASWLNIKDKIMADKKKEGRNIHFVLLNGIGRAVQKEYPLDVLMEKLSTKTG